MEKLQCLKIQDLENQKVNQTLESIFFLDWFLLEMSGFRIKACSNFDIKF